jgi:hypothetical protein
MIKVLLLGTLKSDVSLLLNAAQQGLGRSLSTTLDSRKADLNSQGSWLTLLAAMKAPNIAPEQVICNPGSLAAHSFFSFLVVGPPQTFFSILEGLRPPIVWANTPSGMCLGVVSGDLVQIQSWILTCHSDLSDVNLREFGNQILLILEAQGFSRLWGGFTKKPQPDGTFKLLKGKT